MQAQGKKSGFFYGWVIVLAGTLSMAAIMGILFNCFSQFIKPVCEDLGFTRQAMSLNQTLISLIQVAVALVWGQITTRFDLKKYMMVWAIVAPIAYFSYSMANSIWVFYFLSIIMSISMSSLSVLPFSTIINKWFIEKKGLATGICFMGSGIGGMIFNPLLGQWLITYGWRTSFRILAIVMGCITIPCTLLVKVKPEDIGQKPLGWENAPAAPAAGTEELTGYTLKEARGQLRFWVLLLAIALLNISLCTLVQVLSPHMTDNGYTSTFAATMVSISMAVMAAGKIGLGQLYDMLGVKKTSLLSTFCTLMGLVGLIFCKTPAALVLVILGIGVGCPFGTVASPIIVQKAFGQRDYAAIMGFFNAAANIGGAMAPTGNGTIFDMAGSYNPAFVLWAVTVVITLVCFAVFLPKDKE